MFLAPTARERRKAAGLLARVADDAERVYLTGERPGGRDGPGAWAAELPPGWAPHPRGHYLEGEHPAWRFVRPDGTPLEVLRAAAWYGEGDYSAQTAAQAWELLHAELVDAFGAGAVLLSSPASTGRDLFLRVIPRGREWPTLSADHQELVRATTGQGRIELLPHAGELPELVGYDGRLMYAALCRELPVGPAEHVRATEYLGHTRARYNATAHVPTDWATRCSCGAPGHPGLGLLGVHEHGAGWEYPSEPGRSFSGWWDGAELHVALAHGWTFTYHTALVFPRCEGAGPLDGWATRLVRARDRLAQRHQAEPAARASAKLAAAGVRAIVLHAIGAFHPGRRKVTKSCAVELAAGIPATARDVRTEGERAVWTEYVEPAWPELVHPEWSAAIWARARARLLHAPAPSRTAYKRGHVGALHVPARSLVAFRTDAIYLDHDPGWPDDGRPGRYRRQVRVAGPMPAPASHAQLLEVTGGE